MSTHHMIALFDICLPRRYEGAVLRPGGKRDPSVVQHLPAELRPTRALGLDVGLGQGAVRGAEPLARRVIDLHREITLRPVLVAPHHVVRQRLDTEAQSTGEDADAATGPETTDAPADAAGLIRAAGRRRRLGRRARGRFRQVAEKVLEPS